MSNTGQIGFAPRLIVLEDDSIDSFLKGNFNIDVRALQLLESKIYADLPGIDDSHFSSSMNSCIVKLKEDDEFQLVRDYSVYDGKHETMSFYDYLRVESALAEYEKIRNNPQEQFMEDYNKMKMLYGRVQENLHDIKTGKKRFEMYLSLESRNGGCVFSELQLPIKIDDCKRIPEFEVVQFSQTESRLRSSKKKIPKLNYEVTTTYSINDVTLLDWGSSARRTTEEFPYSDPGKLIEWFNNVKTSFNRDEVLFHLFEGSQPEHELFDFFVQSTIVGDPSVLESLSSESINQEYQRLRTEHIENINEKGNRIVGIALYDVQNGVIHRKLDSNFEQREVDSVFYPF